MKLLITLLLLVVFGSAQTDWRMVVYLEESRELLTLNAGGVTERVTLPDGLFTPDTMINEIKVSPDQRYVAVTAYNPEDGTVPPVQIADLENGTCCVSFELPDAMAYQLAGFDPAGTTLALAFVTYDETIEFPYSGGMMTVDAGTGEIVAQVNMEDVPQEITGDFAITALVGDWIEEGVQFHPSCYACEPPFRGKYSLWNPADNSFTAETDSIFTFFGTQLDQTGEVLMTIQATNYPRSTMPSGLFPISNVVIYGDTGLVEQDDLHNGVEPQAPVVFFDPQDIDLSAERVHWTHNGQAFVVEDAQGTEWHIVYRDGNTETLTVPAGSMMLAGTPEGYVTVEDNTIVYYASGQRTEIETISGAARVVEAPELGAGIDGAQFAEIPVPGVDEYEQIMMDNAVTCEGFMPSRLISGWQGRVTPGDPNTIREYPSTEAPDVGSIPGGETLKVMEGPFCQEGYAWWYVEYNGVFGYTAEGTGDTYYVEPVRPE